MELSDSVLDILDLAGLDVTRDGPEACKFSKCGDVASMNWNAAYFNNTPFSEELIQVRLVDKQGPDVDILQRWRLSRNITKPAEESSDSFLDKYLGSKKNQGNVLTLRCLTVISRNH